MHTRPDGQRPPRRPSGRTIAHVMTGAEAAPDPEAASKFLPPDDDVRYPRMTTRRPAALTVIACKRPPAFP
jgi:hypothetical protein